MEKKDRYKHIDSKFIGDNYISIPRYDAILLSSCFHIARVYLGNYVRVIQIPGSGRVNAVKPHRAAGAFPKVR